MIEVEGWVVFGVDFADVFVVRIIEQNGSYRSMKLIGLG